MDEVKIKKALYDWGLEFPTHEENVIFMAEHNDFSLVTFRAGYLAAIKSDGVKLLTEAARRVVDTYPNDIDACIKFRGKPCKECQSIIDLRAALGEVKAC